MRLEYEIEKLFIDNPDLSRDEAVKRLKEMKDPETGKHRWKAHTIRCQIGTYFNKKEKETHAVHVESPEKTTDPEFNPKIEGKEITRHKPKDPFAINPDRNVEEKVGQIEDKMPVADTEQFKRDIVNDVSKKVLKQVSLDGEPFKDEIISIVSDLKSATVDAITEIRGEISNLQAHGIPACKSIIKYDDIKLRESTIDAIQKNTEDREEEEESDYIDSLIANYYEPIVKNEDYYDLIVEYDDLNLRQSTIDAIQKNTKEKELKEESEYLDNLIKNEDKYILKALKISL